MVKVTIIIEGAQLPHPNVAASTINNSTAFREAFRKLFVSGITNEQVAFQIENAGSDRNAVKMFLRRSSDQLLLIDLEGRPGTQIQRMQSFVDLGFEIEVHGSGTFFMVQKMEAWILSQPDKIEILLANQKVSANPISEDENILNRDPQEIVHPDSVLNTILMRNFKENKNGKQRSMKYRGKKLTLAPKLLELLDLDLLTRTFPDVHALLNKINTTY